MYSSWNIRRSWFKIISEACEIFAVAYILEDLDRKVSSKIGNIWIQHALNSLYQLCLTRKIWIYFKKIWQLSICPCLRGNNTRCLVPGSQQWSWLSGSFDTPWFSLVKLSCVFTSHQYHSGPQTLTAALSGTRVKNVARCLKSLSTHALKNKVAQIDVFV